MVSRKPKVVVTRRLPAAVEARMSELFDAELNLEDVPMDRAALVAAVQRADVLAPTVSDRIDAEVIAAAGPQLRLIANFGVGVDHIDLKAAAARGVVVTNTPGVLTDDTADLAMALILGVSRRLFESAQELQRERGFPGWAPTWRLGRRLKGKTLAIVGMGRIGQALAYRARAFGMSIAYHNRRPVPAALAEALGAEYFEDLDRMLAHADVVSLNCPRTAETRGLISAERLDRLRPHAILINTARGDVVDEAALAAKLRRGELAGAGLDVFEHEPAIHPDLFDLPHVVLIPHLGSATEETRTDMGEKVVVNIRAFMDGHTPPDRVIPADG